MLAGPGADSVVRIDADGSVGRTLAIDPGVTGLLTVDGRPYVDPGETVLAYVGFLNPTLHLGKLYPGKNFVLREGQRIVARGRVTQVIELEQSARQRRGKRQISG